MSIVTAATLAHIAAQHCGYRPMELNASDDRSAEALKETISRATNGNTVYGDKRPNCIILDEIDGIDGRAPIDALINVIKTPLNALKSKGKKSASSGSNTQALTRPLICICNDLFAPQLRELRKHAQVFAFTSPTEIRLVQRLRAICASESISVPSSSISALCNAAGHDIRSCINTLQFAALKTTTLLLQKSSPGVDGSTSSQPNIQGRDVGIVLSNMISTGLKDADKDILQVWNEILCIKEAARSYYDKTSKKLTAGESHLVSNADRNSGLTAYASVVNSGSLQKKNSGILVDLQSLKDIRNAGTVSTQQQRTAEKGATAASNRQSFALEIVESVLTFGDNQLVMSGVFENYLGVRYHDPSMLRTCSASDWMSDSDIFDGKMGDVTGTHQTMAYVSVVAGAIHCLCAIDSKPNVSWPKKVLR